jgi:hypothetical protein
VCGGDDIACTYDAFLDVDDAGTDITGDDTAAV